MFEDPYFSLRARRRIWTARASRGDSARRDDRPVNFETAGGRHTGEGDPRLFTPWRAVCTLDDVQTIVSCPWCGEDNTIIVDEYGGRRQQYVEDCQVCCQPWNVIATIDSEGDAVVELRTGNE
jgi:hypothetical protein